jgi:hypothetical protein
MDDTTVLDNNSAVVAETEKMVPASTVNELIRNKQGEAAAKARQQASVEYERKIEALQLQIDQQNSASPFSGGLDIESVAQKVTANLEDRFKAQREYDQQQAYIAEATKLARSYEVKMAEGAKSYDDFEALQADFNPAAHPDLTLMLAQMDDPTHVAHELFGNDIKLASLSHLAKTDPAKAQKALLKMHKSALENAQGIVSDKAIKVKPPIERSQSTVSHTSGSSGQKTIADYRNLSWLN